MASWDVGSEVDSGGATENRSRNRAAPAGTCGTAGAEGDWPNMALNRPPDAGVGFADDRGADGVGAGLAAGEDGLIGGIVLGGEATALAACGLDTESSLANLSHIRTSSAIASTATYIIRDFDMCVPPLGWAAGCRCLSGENVQFESYITKGGDLVLLVDIHVIDS